MIVKKMGCCYSRNNGVEENVTGISIFPHELMVAIAGLLPMSTLVLVHKVCKQWKVAAEIAALDLYKPSFDEMDGNPLWLLALGTLEYV